MRAVNPEVYQAEGGVVCVTPADAEQIRLAGTTNPRRRARLCAHPNPADRLHEMLIVLDQATYIRPHRHAGKSESFHIIEGELDVVLFDDDGHVQQTIAMGPYGSGKVFFYRLMEPRYHSVLVRSAHVMFHETTNGPFDRSDTEFAPWAPAEGDPAALAYTRSLREAIRA